MNIVTADGLKFIAEAEKQYDVIYLDAFLKPSADTDSTGVPLSAADAGSFTSSCRRS